MWIAYLLFIPALFWAAGWLLALSAPVLIILLGIAGIALILMLPVIVILAVNDNDPVGWFVIVMLCIGVIQLIIHSSPVQKLWVKVKPYIC